jgi:hypothetical protein
VVLCSVCVLCRVLPVIFLDTSYLPALLSSSMSAGMSICASSFCVELVKCSFSSIELLIQQKCFVIGINFFFCLSCHSLLPSQHEAVLRTGEGRSR